MAAIAFISILKERMLLKKETIARADYSQYLDGWKLIQEALDGARE